MRYSQNNEQDYITRYFWGQKGTLLDIGANDGSTLSNSRALMIRGWSGVMVDASPSAFAKLIRTYPPGAKVECHNVAIADHDGEITLHESGPHLSKNDTALLSSVIESETDRWRNSTKFETVTVPCITVESLLDRSKFKRFDFITIDVEGMDLFVLEQMDLTALGTKMLVVEVNDRDVKPYIAHCEKHGLKLLTRTNENLILVK